jgi:hypothetical protein
MHQSRWIGPFALLLFFAAIGVTFRGDHAQPRIDSAAAAPPAAPLSTEARLRGAIARHPDARVREGVRLLASGELRLSVRYDAPPRGAGRTPPRDGIEYLGDGHTIAYDEGFIAGLTPCLLDALVFSRYALFSFHRERGIAYDPRITEVRSEAELRRLLMSFLRAEWHATNEMYRYLGAHPCPAYEVLLPVPPADWDATPPQDRCALWKRQVLMNGDGEHVPFDFLDAPGIRAALVDASCDP